VVDRVGLENRRGVKASVGSNPTPSAISSDGGHFDSGGMKPVIGESRLDYSKQPHWGERRGHA
jgi:hypothetical protein